MKWDVSCYLNSVIAVWSQAEAQVIVFKVSDCVKSSLMSCDLSPSLMPSETTNTFYSYKLLWIIYICLLKLPHNRVIFGCLIFHGISWNHLCFCCLLTDCRSKPPWKQSTTLTFHLLLCLQAPCWENKADFWTCNPDVKASFLCRVSRSPKPLFCLQNSPDATSAPRINNNPPMDAEDPQ